ncbi:MAG: 3-oxoacyl-ACP synthase III [Planctomycetota bacterium]
MRYSRVYVNALGYELAPVVVSSEEIEERLDPLYRKLYIPQGQLEALTGIEERRWWEEGYSISDGALAAARKAMAISGVPAGEVKAVLYSAVCREQFEPAMACRIANELGASPDAAVHDLSNACLGMLNGMIDIANRIELGQIRAGIVVACETARDIVEEAIERLLAEQTMAFYVGSLATLTGGSGAAAIVLSDGSFTPVKGRAHKLLGGCVQTAPEHHALCRWWLDEKEPGLFREWMVTDAPSVMRHGVALGARTWAAFLSELGWTREDVDRIVCHQVGASNRAAILNAIELSEDKDFATFPFLGNMGTVSLPLSAALAHERGFLEPGHCVGFLGIGSGLNCLMLGLEW